MPSRLSRPATGAVIGAGPAGLMAADVMARAGLRVTVFERMPSVGRKFLMAGRGGLNLTHSEPIDGFLQRYADASAWLGPAIKRFSPDDLRAWADGHGEETFVGSSGRVFPRSFKASPLLRAWLRELDELGVAFETRQRWTDWGHDGVLGFSDGSRVVADVCVLALGGASWPRLGADGSWVSILTGKGIEVAPLVASNAGVECKWSDMTVARHAGAPLKRIALTLAGRTVRGEAMISRSGLEGGAIYAVSRELRDSLSNSGQCDLQLDLRPDLDVSQLAARLAKVPRKQSLSNRLRKAAGMSPQAISVWRDCVDPETVRTDDELAHSLKTVKVKVTGIRSIDRAISSAGGIAAAEVGANFMLTKLPGVFVCGEMLDWDAPTGGYLLQACFATGKAAGEGAAAFACKQVETVAAGPD
ncbi:TIGR03862 family flavoprotein [Anderseniella sp. Alg231-50]|uniref:TIGR03862 family flavoprotein n=1 Tax=Anderseniella sp. Alg231-50 TaxID=1922226 RepID=UPI000D561130